MAAFFAGALDASALGLVSPPPQAVKSEHQRENHGRAHAHVLTHHALTPATGATHWAAPGPQ